MPLPQVELAAAGPDVMLRDVTLSLASAAAASDAVEAEVGSRGHGRGLLACALCGPCWLLTAGQLLAPRAAEWSGVCNFDETIRFALSVDTLSVSSRQTTCCCRQHGPVHERSTGDVAGIYVFEQIVEYVTAVGDHVSLEPTYLAPVIVEDDAALRRLHGSLPGCEDMACDYCLGCEVEVCNGMRRAGEMRKRCASARLGAVVTTLCEDEEEAEEDCLRAKDPEQNIVWLSRRVWRASELETLVVLRARAEAVLAASRSLLPIEGDRGGG